MLDPVDPVVRPGLARGAVEVAGQGVAEDVADQRALARARDPGDADEQAERDRDVDPLEVVLPGPDDRQPLLGRLPAGARDRDRPAAREVLPGEALGGGGEVGDGPLRRRPRPP